MLCAQGMLGEKKGSQLGARRPSTEENLTRTDAHLWSQLLSQLLNTKCLHFCVCLLVTEPRVFILTGPMSILFSSQVLLLYTLFTGRVT